MLKQRTLDYIACFSNKDLEGLKLILDDRFILEDPVVKRIEGKSNALIEINKVFTSCKELNFTEKNIYIVASTTIIEFELALDGSILEGVDILEWNKDGKLIELRAYLDLPK